MNNNILYHRNFNSDEQAFPFVSSSTGNNDKTIINNINNEKKIGVTPSAAIGGFLGGALVGGVLANNKLRQEENRRLAEKTMENKNRPNIEGNYYKQVENVANNLEVIFTPMSTILAVKNNKNLFTLDTIEVDEMNENMKKAWKSKDSNYFKSILLGKMYSEMQIAEEAFARRFIKNHYNMKGIIEKKSYDLSAIDELNINSCSYILEKLSAFYDNSEIKQKLAQTNINAIESKSNNYNIDLKLTRPFEKYAGTIGCITRCLGLNSEPSNKAIKSHLENPNYLMKNIKIGFFPDRVIFTLDNNLISTLPLTGMNDEGYNNFLNGDEKYFRNLFVQQMKENLKSANEELSYIEKIAEEQVIEEINPIECLTSSSIHPVVIYLFLLKHYGVEWLKFDIGIIEEILKREFELEEINDSSLNKIMTIMVANQSDSIYTNSYAFEKAVLSLCSKPVDFMNREKENISIQDIVFTIDVLDRVTKNDDIYDNFSAEVIDFIVTILSEKGMYLYSPTSIISSPLEPQFKEIINEFLLRKVKNKMTLLSNDELLDKDIENKCEYISDNANAVLNSLRRGVPKSILNENPNSEIVDLFIRKKMVKADMFKMVRKQVVINLALDKILSIFELEFKNQINKYGLMQ